jgi:predicted GH43/DUF377 family glycosyl hydrolase
MGFTQIGNCGSPLWTEEGWLVITHGVGAMRQYCLGALYLILMTLQRKLADSKIPYFRHVKRNEKSYLMSCILVAQLYNNSLILPYAVSDYLYLWSREYARVIRCLEERVNDSLKACCFVVIIKINYKFVESVGFSLNMTAGTDS